MNKVKSLLIIGIICLASSACALTPNSSGYVTECPAPERPVLRGLKHGQSVCSQKNSAIKTANVNKLVLYTHGLEEAVKCYEAQVKHE